MADPVATTKKPTRFLLNARSFPPGTPQEFKDVIFRVLDTLNGTQGTAYTAEGTANTAQETATGAQDTANTANDTANAAQEGVNDLSGRVTTLESDSVSTSNAGLQTLLGALGLGGPLQIDGVQVVGPRQPGWTNNTGVAKKGGSGDLALPVGAAYSQAEMQAIADAVVENRQLLTAVINALFSHGLIGS
ncbi:tail needle protein [Escherichia phage Skarpretter]|uniref:Putative DNA stabilization protein n=1 Tax=Escherichia phage Skarpretter TaxID=2488654 RepID=A0A3G8F382_9CAUD|nr:tail needle protein [Escherichia phage Skarpretter]AZF88657.1 putative DNA stabilization protein [Escherichia phage Skarpretter]